MSKRADLHVHTTLSDGTFPPEKVVRYASEIGLDCIAVCDHDVIDGIKPSLDAGRTYGVEVIPAIELTAEKHGHEIHVLGFYVDWQDKEFCEELKHLCQQRRKRIYEMVDKLNALGINLDAEDVFKLGGEGSVGRLHLARALHKQGHVATVEDAFRKYIGDRKPCYVAKINLSPEDAIGEIIKAKGIPVLAHPALTGKDEFIRSYIKHGLMGIEVYHPEHTPALTMHYEKIARENGLLITGGSDCHGLGKGRILMGSVVVPYELVEKLKDARR